MAYAIQTWRDKPDLTTPFSADRANHMEAGISAADTAAANAYSLAQSAFASIGGNSNTIITDPPGNVGLPINLPSFESASAATSVGVRIPTQVAVGSLAVVLVVGQGTAITAPAGWALQGKVTTGGVPTVFGALYTRLLSASDIDASFTWTGITSGRVSLIGTTLPGVDLSTPIDVAAGLSANGVGLVDNTIAPSLNTSKVNVVLISVGFGSMVTGDLSTPSAMVKLTGTIGTGYRAVMAIEPRTAAGTTGVRTWVTNPLQTALLGSINLAVRPMADVVPPPAAPTAGFLADPISGDAPLAVSFLDQSGNLPTSWAWTFGDGGTSTSASPSHSYAAAGTYTATLTATNAGGSTVASRAISVTDPAAFSAAIAMSSNGVSGESAAATTCPVTLPAVATGQVAVISIGASSTAITGAAGWTLIDSTFRAETPILAAAYYKVGPFSAATHTFTGLTSGRVTGEWAVFDNVNTTTVLDCASAEAGSPLSTAIDIPGVTTASAGALFLQSVTMSAASSTDFTVPASMTKIAGSTGTGRRHCIAYEARSTAGATGSRTWTEPTGQTLIYCGVAYALRPATASGSPVVVVPSGPTRGALIWEDNFNGAAGSGVNTADWSYETGSGIRNGELQNYTSSAANVQQDGLGNLKITCTGGPGTYASGSIHTAGKHDFLNCFYEARIRTPSTSGIWPAFWTVDGAWPTNGEIDFMEQINTDPNTNFNVHGGPSHWQSMKTVALNRDPTVWHIYGCRVSPGKVEFYLDNVLVHTITGPPAGQSWPFDTNRQHIRFNVAIGGSWPGTPSGAVLPASMYVDYIRVYEYQGTGTTPPTDSGNLMPASTGSEVLVNRVVGPTADDGTVRIKTRTTGLGAAGKARLRIGTNNPPTAGLVYTTPVTPNAQGDYIHVVGGLTRGVRYYARTEMNQTTDTRSAAMEIPVFPVAGSFAFCFGSCCNAGDSPAMLAIANRKDQLFINLGDFWYADGTGANTGNYRTQINGKFAAANHSKVFDTVPSVFTPSDHDLAMKNNGVGTVDAAAAAIYNSVARENFPAPFVAPTLGVHYTFAYGRVRFVVTDTRSLKSDPLAADNSSKTMFGTAQKNWLLNIIATFTEKVLVITSDVSWAGPTTSGADDWGGYNTERIQIGNAIAARATALGRTNLAVIISGDSHSVSHSSGQAFGRGIPNYGAAPLTNNSSIKGAPWDAVYPTSGTSVVNQYGRVAVTDSGGSVISLVFTGYSVDGSAVSTSRVVRTDTFTGV